VVRSVSEGHQVDSVKPPPSHSEFTAAVREAFPFFGSFGFQEVAAPAHMELGG
jgi:hypothetical protein